MCVPIDLVAAILKIKSVRSIHRSVCVRPWIRTRFQLSKYDEGDKEILSISDGHVVGIETEEVQSGEGLNKISEREGKVKNTTQHGKKGYRTIICLGSKRQGTSN